MVWALALVVVIGVGLPVAAWLITRRLPSLRTAGRLGAGYDEVDRWLLDQYQLAWLDRSRVRKAVFQGQEVNDPALIPAAHGLAVQVLANGFKTLRFTQRIGRVELVIGPAYAVFGVVSLITSHHDSKLALGVLAVVNGGLFTLAGVFRALRAPKQMRHYAERVLQLNQKST